MRTRTEPAALPNTPPTPGNPLLDIGDIVERVDLGGIGSVTSVDSFENCHGDHVWQYSIEPFHDGLKSAWFFRRDLVLKERGPAHKWRHLNNDDLPWPRRRELPEPERAPFGKWLIGQAVPSIEGAPEDEQDGYYEGDYRRWKTGLPSAV